MLRVAVLSRWHVHADQYAREVAANDRAEVALAWDERPDLGAQWAAKLGVPFEPDLSRLLTRDDIDAVTVTTPTDMHPDVMVRAAKAGKHIFTEKVLATTVADAERIAAAVATAGVAFCISFPRRCAPDILYARQALDEGLLGRVTALRVRIAHDGAVRDWLPEHFYDPKACGGGAMMDLGAHGMYLAQWLLGQPRRITSVFSTVTGRAVDDNAVSVIEFEGGAIAVNETSFASSGSYALEMDGTEGAYRMLSPAEGAEVRSQYLSTKGWHAPPALPEARPKPVDQWIDACLDGTPVDFDMAEAVALTEIMEAGYLADREGRTVTLPGHVR
ncbi:MAG: Gfo/Idh/MocA family oxidoreductase [Gammaproteobacteria bacterium]|nr:Gfo/Idh/MocA family oxidoreductase [Gammaproteobacteria bacterium]